MLSLLLFVTLVNNKQLIIADVLSLLSLLARVSLARNAPPRTTSGRRVQRVPCAADAGKKGQTCNDACNRQQLVQLGLILPDRSFPVTSGLIPEGL
ncbi:hypothetical protein L596_024852 [Steinernema carpocapsae]|uniref:Secreted protein n=1 Tax=Steinernema carpocapsae TaxID=34508 RepID=A0A4U5M602_STECR|nr:hypothetical protein L596_024852 [Steinernema carpocapsae]